ncbi:MAG: EexN family lipoprotein [bacterium]
MKKMFLIFGVLIFAGLLSGCAKNNPAMIYHSYSYYTKHKKQAKATYAACKQNPDFTSQKSRRFDLSKENTNCWHAYNNIINHFKERGSL